MGRASTLATGGAEAAGAGAAEGGYDAALADGCGGYEP
jgi:hypothetical protein